MEDSKGGIDSLVTLKSMERAEPGDTVLEIASGEAFHVRSVDVDKQEVMLGKPYEVRDLGPFPFSDFRVIADMEHPLLDMNRGDDEGSHWARRLEANDRFPEDPTLGLFRDSFGTLFQRWQGGGQAYPRDHHRNLGRHLGPMDVRDI